MYVPKLVTTLRNYSGARFAEDATAGLIVGIVALPLAIAFAIASGVSPEKGIITAIIGGFIVSALGGSRVSIAGPTGAFVVIIYGIVQTHGIDGLVVATIMAGVILVVMGLARFGAVIKFIPHPVIVGFTSGIALIIFVSQIKDLLGLKMGAVPADFFEKMSAYGSHFSTINLAALAIAAGALLIQVYWPKVSRRVPGSLVALLVATAATQLLGLNVETIGSRFGEISSAIPTPAIPGISFALVKELFPSALTIALLAAIESLLCAVVADGMIGGKHRSNMELVAQGIANIVAPLFGGIPVTGAIARTATNVRNGGRTPVAGIVHAAVLLVIMLAAAPWAALIPLPALSAILVIVAYNMSEWRSFRSLMRSPRSDVIVLLVTFGLTVVFDLTVAIEVGMVLSVFLFMRRMATITNVGVVTREFNDDDPDEDESSIESREIPEGVDVYEINGPFFFGAAYKFEEALISADLASRVRIIRMRNVPAIDSTGLHALEQALESCRNKGIVLIISGIHAQPYRALEASGLLANIGEENVIATIDDALERAKLLLTTHTKQRHRD
jgi:SulP family sulfate permease